MKNLFKLLMVVGLLAIMLPMLFGVLGPVGAGPTEIVKDHADSKNIDNATCIGCHDPNELDPNDAAYAGAHRRHFMSAFLNFYDVDQTSKGCGRCHIESVYGGGVGEGLGSGYEGDLSYASTGTENADFERAANKQVKPDVCETCHGQFSPNGHSGVSTNQGCVKGTCHVSGGSGGDAETKHAVASVGSSTTAGYINADYAVSPTFCLRCHGELAWFLTTETSNTLEQ